jgi:hypothetical protein
LNERYSLLTIIKAMVTIAGIIIAVLGGMGGIFLALTMLFSPEIRAVDNAVTSLALIVLGGGLGGALAWHGRNAFLNRASAPFQPPPLWALLVPYIPILILGQLILSFNLLPVLTFPLFHILAAAIPPLTVLAFAGQVFKPVGFRWREVMLQLSSGSLLSMMIAFVIELMLVLFILVIAMLIIILIIPDSLAFIEELTTHFEDPLWLQEPNNVSQLLSFPPVSITLIVTFVILIPIIEELVKPLGVALMSYRRPSQVQAFLWGLAGGAGFALIENIFNTLLTLQGWAFVAPLRIGATAMHCLGSGLIALGWHHLLVKRRPWWLMATYGLSVTIHAVWNATAVTIVGIALFAFNANNQTALALGGIFIALLLGFLLMLALGIIAALIALVYWLRPRH